MAEKAPQDSLKAYFTSLIMSLFLLGVRLSIIEHDYSIPIVKIKIKPEYFLPLLATITIGAYIYYLKKNISLGSDKNNNYNISKAFLGLTSINLIAIVSFLTFYFPLHIIVEVCIFGIMGLIIGTTSELGIAGLFYIRTDKDVAEKWLPKIPFAVQCSWKMASRLPYLIAIMILIAINYHCYIFSYSHTWTISFVIMFLFTNVDIILFGLATILHIKKLKQYAIRNIKIFESAIEIHDRDYLLFGHRKIPTLDNQPKLILAARLHDINTIMTLLKQGEKPDTADALGWTSLMIAAAENQTEILKLMIEYGANVNSENVFGRTALHFSSKYGFTDIVKILIANGAIINATNDHSGQPPIFAAIEQGHIEIVDILLAGGADTSLKNRDKLTALEYAEKLNKVEIARILRVHQRKNGEKKPFTFLEYLRKSRQ